MNWKHLVSAALVACLAMTLSGCGSSPDTKDTGKATSHITVFAAASMTETLNEIAAIYQMEHPDVEITYNFDSSGTLKKQIENGAACDLFISAAPKQMNQLDASQNEKNNPQQLDFIEPATRINLLENKVVLVGANDNAKGIRDFDDWADRMKSGDLRLVMGNSDVPVGQYTQKIMAYYKLDEQALAADGRISYGSNVKEVTTQVLENSADCGIIYATDAYSAGLKPIAAATKDMCGQVIYPAAVLKESKNREAAAAFLQYLKGEEAMKIFEHIGFSRAG